MTIHNTGAGGRPPAADGHSAGTEAAHESGCGTICCVPRPQRAWSPPVLPADTSAKRRVDRLLPGRGLPAVAYFAAVIGLLGLAQILPAPAYLIVDAVAFLAGGSWCAMSFWRCRQAHCLLTGSGWLLLALFAAAEAGLGHSVIGGDEQLVFLGILAIGLVFEATWYLMHRTNALAAAQPADLASNSAGAIPEGD
jgi:hypothetical protein